MVVDILSREEGNLYYDFGCFSRGPSWNERLVFTVFSTLYRLLCSLVSCSYRSLSFLRPLVIFSCFHPLRLWISQKHVFLRRTQMANGSSACELYDIVTLIMASRFKCEMFVLPYLGSTWLKKFRVIKGRKKLLIDWFISRQIPRCV